MNPEDHQAYRKHISDIYDGRSGNHDKSEWHRSTALKLVEDLPPCQGDSVMDIGTGSGTIAFHSASLVSAGGKVVGIDLSEGMLAQANVKLASSGLNNLEFILADAENLTFPSSSFDRMYCASAFFCLLDPGSTLKHWHDLLKPGGSLAFHALPDTSYVWVSEARRALENYGISYDLNTPTGTKDKTHQLLVDSGFKSIEIIEDKQGFYIPLEQAKNGWLQTDFFLPGQYPNPLIDVPLDIVKQAQGDYDAIIDDLNTEKGVWNDISMYYVYARK